ncbi:MAG TPA: glycosyltransferase [Saprospiraceae bacterium]|nr:glycosyltransferase [Saprospiraceae bacterium]
MRIAFVTSRFPFPVEKGDKLRAYHQIRLLSRIHEIHLVAISHRNIKQEDLDAMTPFCKTVTVFKIKQWLLPIHIAMGWIEGLPLQITYFLDRTIKRKVQYHIIRIEPDHVICQLIRAAEYVRALPFPKTLDYMDVFSEGMLQLAKRHKWFGLFFKMEAKRLASYERTLYKDFDNHIIISEQDKERLKLPSKKFIVVVPNGVDERFSHDGVEQTPTYDLVFVGNLGYGPNKSAVKFLVSKILPVLEERKRTIKLLIAGARPGHSILKYGKQKNIKVIGWMEDIRDAYRQGSIFVAPMLSGLGLQNKILEAMSMGLPCVTTSMVNNAIGAINNEQILIADTSEKFVDQILFLLDHPDEHKRIAMNGKEFVNDHFKWEDQVKKMDEVIHTKNAYLLS